jgi:hypothetical protein
MARAPDPLSVQYEAAATGLVERAIRRSANRRVALRWAVGIVQRPDGVSWERLELAFNRALYRSPQVYHRSDTREWSLKKPVWFAPLGRTREVRIRVFPVRQAYRYIETHPGAGMDWAR